MRHFRLSFVLLTAALLSVPAGAQEGAPPVITSVLAATSSSDLMSPLTPSITAGAGAGGDLGFSVGLVVTGSNFQMDGGSVLVWVPSAGGCPIASCVIDSYASSSTLLYAYPVAELFANPDPGARVIVRNWSVIDSAPFPFPVNPRMANATLPTAYSNVPYAAYITTGGTGPYSIIDSIPDAGAPGLSISNSTVGGVIVGGTPTAAGEFQGNAAANDAWHQFAPSTQFSVSVASLPMGVVGRPYFVQSPFVGAGFAFDVTTGSLPPGIGVGLTNGVITISGSPTAAGMFTAGVQVTSTFVTAGPNVVATGTVQIQVVAPVAILTTALPLMPLSGNYSAGLSATGGVPPYFWSITSGGLPLGLSLNPSTGVISGTPASGPSTLAATVTDSAGSSFSRTFNLNYVFRITNSTLPAATVGATYIEYVRVSGGSGSYAVTLTSGALPAGLVMDAQGLIAGVPTTYGSSTFTVQATDRADATQDPVSQTYTLKVNPGALTITTASQLPGMPKGPISLTLAAAGGTPPYSWAVTAGSLPPGAALSAAGALGGSTTALGIYSFTATVTDSAGATASKPFSIEITTPPVSITTSSLPAATVSTAYSASLSATGGAPPYTWSAGGLPAGLALSGASITGTPTAGGDFQVALGVRDSSGATSSATLKLSVAVQPLTLNPAIPDARAGAAYSAAVGASGGVPPYQWNLTQAAPSGFGLSTSGTLSGTPAAAGTLSFAVKVTDAQGSTATGAISLRVLPALLRITTEALAGCTAGAACSHALVAEGGTPPFTWSGSLPQGLTMDPAAGVIRGVPLMGGARTLDVTVADSTGAVDRRSYTVHYAMPALPSVVIGGVTPTSLPAAQPSMDLKLTGSYPLAIIGAVTLTFAPDSGADDPAIMFASGGRTASFTIAPGGSAAIFTGPAVQLQTGTVAGVITLTAHLESGGMDITPSPAPSVQIRVVPGAPVITDVKATRESGSITVRVWGYSTSRSVTSARFSFPTNDVAVQFASQFSGWYGSPGAAPFGGQFLLTQTFSVSGDGKAVTSVKVTLTNALGDSGPFTVAIP